MDAKGIRSSCSVTWDLSRMSRRTAHGQKRSNDTHQSVTDPEAKLYRKGNGKEARLYYAAHVLERESKWTAR